MDDDLKRLIETTATETRRHFDIVAEGLRHDVQLAFEGVSANGERLDQLAVEMKQEFAEVRSMIRFSYSELDRRLRTLEEIVVGLQGRVERLESGSTQ